MVLEKLKLSNNQKKTHIMKVTKNTQGIIQIEVEDIAEEQVLLRALEFYAWRKKHSNPSHQALAIDMYEGALDKFVEGVELVD